jgi:hypothetical protein
LFIEGDEPAVEEGDLDAEKMNSYIHLLENYL